MNEITKPAPEERYELADTIGIKRFTGVQLAEVSTDKNNKSARRPVRWTDLALYTITQGEKQGSYVLEIVGCSDVFHTLGGKCGFGQRTPSSKLSDTAVPCRDCKPTIINGRPVEAAVAMETDRAQVYVCDTPQEVLTHLKDRFTNKISAPSVSLLQEAALVDAGIRSLTETVEDI